MRWKFAVGFALLMTLSIPAAGQNEPFLVKDINLGTGNSIAPYPNFGSLKNVNGTLFFQANDGTNGYELWKSDGTAAGTVLVKVINPGTGSSYLPSIENVNGTLFFGADDGTNGYELWKSDGTAAGTMLMKDISPGTRGSAPFALTNVNGTLFFQADDGPAGQELWKSDGTAAGTVLVKDIYPGQLFSGLSGFLNVNGTLFFHADDGTNGQELWKSDGTAAGTVLVKDIYPGTGSSSPRALTNANGTLFFQADDGTNGKELWKSDGTAAGTVLVKDIFPGTGSSFLGGFTNMNGTLFFAFSEGGVNSDELWKSDGTVAGTVLVKIINPATGRFGAFLDEFENVNGTLFFEAGGDRGNELWKSDGTAAGTVLVKVINPAAGNSFLDEFENVNGTLYFQADDGTNGLELWKSDGTVAGTVLVKDILPGTGNSAPTGLTNVNGTLFFAADDGTNGNELWELRTSTSQWTGTWDVLARITSGPNPALFGVTRTCVSVISDDGATITGSMTCDFFTGSIPVTGSSTSGGQAVLSTGPVTWTGTATNEAASGTWQDSLGYSGPWSAQRRPEPPGGFTLGQPTAYCDTSPPPSTPAVLLGWTPASGATSYDVYRNGSLYFAGITGTSFQNEINVTAGQAYSYFVRARNAIGFTDSNQLTANVPSGVCGTYPGNFALNNATAVCNGTAPSIQLTWGASAGATSYDVYRNGSLYFAGVQVPGTTFENSGNVSAGATYTYFIRAGNAAGTADSNPVSVSVPAASCGLPPDASLLTRPIIACDQNGIPKVILAWTAASGATTYDLSRDGNLIASGLQAATFEDTANLAEGAQYSYRVVARNGAGTATSPSVVAHVQYCQSTSGPLKYVALGDSYSSGEGAGRYTPETSGSPGNLCHRSAWAWPKMIRRPGFDADLLKSNSGFAHIACSGAVVSDVRKGGSSTSNSFNDAGEFEVAQLDQARNRLSGPPFVVDQTADLVTITIGGNDIGFSIIAEICSLGQGCGTQFYRDGSGAWVTLSSFVDSQLQSLSQTLPGLLREIRCQAPNASVFLVGYPLPISEDGCLGLSNSDSFQSLFQDLPEAAEIRTAGFRLNATMRDAAEAAGVHYVFMIDAFSENEACDEGEDWITPRRLYSLQESLHPNYKGQIAYADAVNDRIKEVIANPPLSWGLLPSGLPANEPELQCPPSAIAARAAAAPADLDQPTLDKLDVRPEFALPCDAGGTLVPGLPVHVSGTGFSADAAVTLEVFAAGNYETVLWAGVAAPDGSLDVGLVLPSDLPTGHVLVHATGTGANGSPRLLSNLLRVVAAFEDDADGDLVPDVCDSCPQDPNPLQLDSDLDGQGVPCDPYPNDPDNDLDQDGLGVPADSCPLDPQNDIDSDGVCGDIDNCPDTSNSAQADIDRDAIGNRCDGDLDNDGVLGLADSTAFSTCLGLQVGPGAGPTEDPTCEESDIDSDGLVDDADSSLIRALFAAKGGDWDGDGIPDDGDGAGVPDDNPCAAGQIAGCDDNCREVLNPGQGDGGGVGAGSRPDGVGDACQCGDVNGDTRVTFTDATILFNEARGNPTGALLAPERTDVNGNGRCTTGDATILFNFLRGVPGASIRDRCFDSALTCP